MLHDLKAAFELFGRHQALSVAIVMAQAVFLSALIFLAFPYDRVGLDGNIAIYFFKASCVMLTTFFITYPLNRLAILSEARNIDIAHVFLFGRKEFFVWALLSILFSLVYSITSFLLRWDLITLLALHWFLFVLFQLISYELILTPYRDWISARSRKRYLIYARVSTGYAIVLGIIILVSLIPLGLGLIFSLPIVIFSCFVVWKRVSSTESAGV